MEILNPDTAANKADLFDTSWVPGVARESVILAQKRTSFHTNLWSFIIFYNYPVSPLAHTDWTREITEIHSVTDDLNGNKVYGFTTHMN